MRDTAKKETNLLKVKQAPNEKRKTMDKDEGRECEEIDDSDCIFILSNIHLGTPTQQASHHVSFFFPLAFPHSGAANLGKSAT